MSTDLKNPRLATAAYRFGGVQKLAQYLGVGDATIRRLDKKPLPKVWSLAIDQLLDSKPKFISEITHVPIIPRRLGSPKPPIEEMIARQSFFTNQIEDGLIVDYYVFTGEERDLGPAINERERWTNSDGLEIEAPREEGHRHCRL